MNFGTLRIQVCPKKGINPTILLLGWDWDHQTYSNREGYGSLGVGFDVSREGLALPLSIRLVHTHHSTYHRCMSDAEIQEISNRTH